MKKNKLQVGDFVLVVGPSHYEKATVIKVDKTSVTLDNNMKIDQEYNNMVKSQLEAKPWDEAEFEYLHTMHRYKTNLASIQNGFLQLSREDRISVNNKLEKILTKYNIKKF